HVVIQQEDKLCFGATNPRIPRRRHAVRRLFDQPAVGQIGPSNFLCGIIPATVIDNNDFDLLKPLQRLNASERQRRQIPLRDDHCDITIEPPAFHPRTPAPPHATYPLTSSTGFHASSSTINSVVGAALATALDSRQSQGFFAAGRCGGKMSRIGGIPSPVR